MLTPSLVFAYWMRGSITPPPPRPQPTPAPPPPPPSAPARRGPRTAPPPTSAPATAPSPDQHLPRRRQPRNARGNVDGAAVDVVVLSDHVAGVEAEVEGQATLVARLPARHRRLDRLAGEGEDGEDAVAEKFAFDGGAGVLADDVRKVASRSRALSRKAASPRRSVRAVESAISAKRMMAVPDGRSLDGAWFARLYSPGTSSTAAASGVAVPAATACPSRLTRRAFGIAAASTPSQSLAESPMLPIDGRQASGRLICARRLR